MTTQAQSSVENWWLISYPSLLKNVPERATSLTGRLTKIIVGCGAVWSSTLVVIGTHSSGHGSRLSPRVQQDRPARRRKFIDPSDSDLSRALATWVGTRRSVAER